MICNQNVEPSTAYLLCMLYIYNMLTKYIIKPIIYTNVNFINFYNYKKLQTLMFVCGINFF